MFKAVFAWERVVRGIFGLLSMSSVPPVRGIFGLLLTGAFPAARFFRIGITRDAKMSAVQKKSLFPVNEFSYRFINKTYAFPSWQPVEAMRLVLTSHNSLSSN